VSVFEDVGGAADVLARAVAGLEPGALDGSDATTLVELFTRCERIAVAGRGLAARRVESSLVWKREGHRSAAHWLAATTGVSVGAATRSLQTARELEALPATAAAFAAGELSEAQASEIAATATLDPSAEARLLALARSSSFKGLRDECRAASVRAGDDDAAAARRLHESRALHSWTDRDGMYRLDARLAPDDGARVEAALRAKTDEIFRHARREGRHEPLAAYRADALVALVNGELPAKPIEVRLDADLAALVRGWVEGGERCEIAGIGPIPVTIARGLFNDARITILGHQDGEVSQISSPDRTIPAKLRRWLERTYPVCGVEACENEHRLEIDHVITVEDHGPTNETNCWRICAHHHKLKTYYHWQVHGPVGNRRLVAPDEPDPP